MVEGGEVCTYPTYLTDLHTYIKFMFNVGYVLNVVYVSTSVDSSTGIEDLRGQENSEILVIGRR